MERRNFKGYGVEMFCNKIASKGEMKEMKLFI